MGNTSVNGKAESSGRVIRPNYFLFRINEDIYDKFKSPDVVIVIQST